MGDLPMGGAPADLMPGAFSTPFPESNPLQICTENWEAADKATCQIIRKVQATPESEVRRRKVVDYVQNLIRNRLGAEVFPYGSVPLKTYLPDGDIDLTAFGGANIEDSLVDDIRLLLEEEEKNTAPEFVVKDVQIIRAEVKLVKCIVQDIVVDVSFNQIGGLCTLCFLEQVDRLIGKDHLFKRSIILIKAWCYYESRILGAHHGLISTYALETLVLYIFHLFHSALDGPLAVLFKFLDYFSKFDWDTYCVSLHGPVQLSSMPDIVVEMPEDSDRELLLSNEFLNSCAGMFSVPYTSADKALHTFQRKHLNIVDPLKEINNLGRSVSKGNFYRIRSAFSYGARKLEQILLQPTNSIANELHKFFPNTMARHGGGQRPDVQDFESSRYKKLLSGVHIPEMVLPRIDNSHELDRCVNSTGGSQSTGKLSQDLNQELESKSFDMANREQHSCSVFKNQSVPLDRDQSSKPSALDPTFIEGSHNLDVSGLGSLKISPDTSICQTPVLEDTTRTEDKPFCAPHLYFLKSKTHDGSVRDVNQDLGKCDVHAKNAVLLAPNLSSTSDHPNQRDMELNSACAIETKKPECSSDLSGDYDGYLRCLQYAKWCYEYGLGLYSLYHVPPLPLIMYQNCSLWDGVQPASHFKQNGFSHRHLNGFSPNPAVHAMRPVLLPAIAFGWEEAPKPKGTGTYIPNMNQLPHGNRSSTMKGKNQATSRSSHGNGRHMTFEPNMVDRRSHEPSQPQVPVEKSLVVSTSDNCMPFSPRGSGFPNTANGLCIQPESRVEFEIVGHGSGTSVPGKISQPEQMLQPPLSREQDRISLSSSLYHLRDEDDFPPLCVRMG